MEPKRKLLLGIFAGVIVLAFVFMYYFNTNSNLTTENNSKYMKEMVVQYAKIADAQLSTAFSYINNAATVISEHPDMTAWDLDKHVRTFSNDGPVNFICTITKDGNCCYRDSINDISDQDYFIALKKGQAGITNTIISQYSGKQVIVFYAPLRSKNTDVIGIAGLYNLEDLQQKFEEESIFEEASYNLLTNKAEPVIGEALKEKGILCREEAFLTAQSGSITYDLDGEGLIHGYYAPLITNGWMAYVRVPDSIIEKLSRPIMRNTFIFLIVLTVIVVLFCLLLILIDRKQRIHLQLMNKKLSMSNQSFEIAIDKMEGDLFEIDLENDILRQSRCAIGKFLTFAQDIAMPEGLFAGGVVHPDSLSTVKTAYEDIKSGQKLQNIEIRVRSEGGRYLWAKVILSPVFDEAQKAVYAIGVIEDISKKKMMEGRLLREEYICKKHINDSHFVLVENITKKEIVKSWCDGKVQEKFEYENLPNFWRFCVHPDEQIQVEKYFKESSLLRQFENGIHDAEFTCRIIEKRQELWMKYEMRMLQDPSSSEVFLYVYARDMSKEKEAEKRKQQKEQRRSLIIEALSESYEGIYSVGLKKDTYEVVKALPNSSAFDSSQGEYSITMEKHVENKIYPNDREHYVEELSLEALRKKLADGIEKFDFEYRQVEGDGYQWKNVQVLFIAISADNDLILSVRNIYK